MTELNVDWDSLKLITDLFVMLTLSNQGMFLHVQFKFTFMVFKCILYYFICLVFFFLIEQLKLDSLKLSLIYRHL